MNSYTEIACMLKQHLINLSEVADVEINNTNISQPICFSSSLYAVLKFHSNEKPLNLFLKICLENSALYKMNKPLRLLDKEIAFYSKILPLLLDFESNGPPTDSLQRYFSSKTPLKDLFATFYGSCNIGENTYIMLEKIPPDLKFLPKDEFFHDIQAIKFTLKYLALFHASSYALKQKQLIDFECFPILKDFLCDSKSNNIMYEFCNGFFRTNIKVLKAVVDEVLNGNESFIKRGFSVNFDVRLIDRLKQLNKQFIKILHNVQLGKKKTNVLCHGDFHMYNVAYSKCNKLIKFVDFQLIRYSTCMTDVLQYLFQVCSAKFRREYLKEYLSTYEESFLTTCQHYGVEIDYNFTYHGLLKEYKNAYPWGFLYGFIFNLQRFSDEDFYEKLENVENSEEIIAILFKQRSPMFWDVLKTYMPLMEEAEDYDAISHMEKLADV